MAQLLAFSRPRRGERRLLAVTPVARQALQLLRPNLPSSIVVECDEICNGTGLPLPPVLADPVQLEQVLFNLCLNARDAIRDHGTIGVRIGHSAAPGHCASCSARLEDSRWVWVEVADDGCGMAAEVIERMFEPFFTTKEVGRGTGMGLAMVHGIVHDHGGHIQVRVRSWPGIGVPGAVAGRGRGRLGSRPRRGARAGSRAPRLAAAGPGAAGRRRVHRRATTWWT